MGNDAANEGHCAAVNTSTSRHTTASRISLRGKVTPVGFEPTPLRNGALSHRLRPLGQSVLGTTFWHQNDCYTAVLGDLRHNSRYLWARRRTPISTPARRAPDHSHNSGGLSPPEGSSVLPELRPSVLSFRRGLLCCGRENDGANEGHCAEADTFTTRHTYG